ALASIAILITGCAGVKTPPVPGTAAGSLPIFDVNAFSMALTVGAQVGTHLAVEQNANAAAYLSAAELAINAAVDNGKVDPVQLRASLLAIKVKEIHSDEAIMAIDAGLKIYELAFGQAVSSQVNRVDALPKLLTALAQGIHAGLLEFPPMPPQ